MCWGIMGMVIHEGAEKSVNQMFWIFNGHYHTINQLRFAHRSSERGVGAFTGKT